MPDAVRTTASAPARAPTAVPSVAVPSVAGPPLAAVPAPAALVPDAPVPLPTLPPAQIRTGNALATRLAGTSTDPAVTALRADVDAALRTVVARAHVGVDPAHPLGEPRTGVVALGGSLGVIYEGGSNHPLGSALVVDPTSKQAFHIKHGFYELALRPQAELGGRPTLDALGAPLEDERFVDGASVQRFEHGTLRWSFADGGSIDPPTLLADRASSLLHTPASTSPDLLALVAKETRGALLAATWLAPLPHAGEGHSDFFLQWALKQVATNPAVATVHQQVGALLASDARPDRLHALLDAARSFATAALASEAGVDDVTRAHLVDVTALVALSAWSLKNDHGPQVSGFPVFMWDGRTSDGGYDKAWHFTNHAMMAYVLRFAADHGDSAIDVAFHAAVEHADHDGLAQRVARTYHERQGALGGLVSWVVSGPPDEAVDDRPYAPPPEGLSADEQRAFDAAVRIGDAHEVKASGDELPVGLDEIGDFSRRWDPLAELHARFHRVWGLQDYGVTRDLTANRLGARFGVDLYRAAASGTEATTSFPYDEGKLARTGPYAAERKVPFAIYLAEEQTMLELLATPGDGAQTFAAHTASIAAEGKDPATARVRSLLESTFDQLLAAGDHDELARFYGNFAIRHQRFGERVRNVVENNAGFHPSSIAHTTWARERFAAGEADQVKWGLLWRFDDVIASAA